MLPSFLKLFSIDCEKDIKSDHQDKDEQNEKVLAEYKSVGADLNVMPYCSQFIPMEVLFYCHHLLQRHCLFHRHRDCHRHH